ncbi:hypothetical protein FT663_00958 [Candidozyma haemuli var. vulneris]|nr:hypothetical protein FT662_00762 [[Candida] haemuloni var. vulneris]KAF3994984.1 hypothetical protein FT663_00958 [[Candida] haemuloni var. vulneris]
MMPGERQPKRESFSEPLRLDDPVFPYLQQTQADYPEAANVGNAPAFPGHPHQMIQPENTTSANWNRQYAPAYHQGHQQPFQYYQQSPDFIPPMPVGFGERSSFGDSSSYGDRSSFGRSSYERNSIVDAEEAVLGRPQKRSSSDEMLSQNTGGSLRHMGHPMPIHQHSRLSSRPSPTSSDSSFSRSPVRLATEEAGLLPSHESTSFVESSNMLGSQSYPDMTTMVNSDSNMSVPLVETTFVDPTKCTVCGKTISRDMTRHMWTHQSEKRFKCVFPKGNCRHKSGSFNRRYDFKKHLLNKHFRYDDESTKREHNLREKLSQWGTCPCGKRYLSGDWLNNHILTTNESQRCPLIKKSEF